MEPFDRFNDRAKRVLALAQDEAIRLNHNYIGTEHLLLGLVREGDGVAAGVLASLGVELSEVRTAVEFIIGRGDQTTTPSEITLSPRTKKVIELAIDEARRMGDEHVGTEHILLGLVREGEGIASGILESLGIELGTLRQQVLKVMGRNEPTSTPTPTSITAFRERAIRVLQPKRSLRTTLLTYVVALAPAITAAVAAAVIGAAASVLIRGEIDWALVVAVLAGFVTLGLAMLPANAPRSWRSATTSTHAAGTRRFVGGATRVYQAPVAEGGPIGGLPGSQGVGAGRGPFDQFSDRAKRALALAQDEAMRANHNYIGTEHLLVGLAREGASTGFRALSRLGLSYDKLYAAMIATVGQGPPRPTPTEMTLNPLVKKVIELAKEEATKLGHNYIGTEHLLLGLVIDGQGAVVKILKSLGTTVQAVHKAVIDEINRKP